MVRELSADTPLFPGFRCLDVETPQTVIRLRTGGAGPPPLLLHGHPQTHVLWDRPPALLRERLDWERGV